jgi:acyl-CoA synthetase (AMP-forming)/AMP-acid ligase II
MPFVGTGECCRQGVDKLVDQFVKQLKTWSNERLGKQQRLSDVILVDELPRNPNGKILKRELREQYKDKRYA